MEFKSNEEIWFSWWIEELKEAGYIKSWEAPKTYALTGGFARQYERQSKKGVVLEVQTILEQHVYTPDAEIEFTEKAYGVFVAKNGQKWEKHMFLQTKEGTPCIFEVKPEYDHHNMTRLNSLNRKWLMANYGLFVNLVQPTKLFKSTFTPKKYLLTPTGRNKKINYTVYTLEQFIESLNK
jgi:hypothetical protein